MFFSKEWREIKKIITIIRTQKNPAEIQWNTKIGNFWTSPFLETHGLIINLTLIRRIYSFIYTHIIIQAFFPIIYVFNYLNHFLFHRIFKKNSITSSFRTTFCNIVMIYHISMLFHLISFRDVCFLAASMEVRVCPTGKNKHIHARVSFLGPETDVIFKWVRDSKFSS